MTACITHRAWRTGYSTAPSSFPTHNQRQTVFPFGAELWFAWPLLFLKYEVAGRLAFWAGLPLGAVGVGTVGQAIGLGRTARLAAVLLYIATPTVLLRATSLKSDLWVPVFLLGAAYFAVRGALPGEPIWRRHLLAGGCLALAVSIKVTAAALVFGLLLAAAIEGSLGNRLRAIGALGIGAVMGIVLSGLAVLLGWNTVHHGHPLGPPALNRIHRAELSPRQLYVHAVRTPLTLLELPTGLGDRPRRALERVGQTAARMTGADTRLPLEEEGTWPGRFSFSLSRTAWLLTRGAFLVALPSRRPGLGGSGARSVMAPAEAEPILDPGRVSGAGAPQRRPRHSLDGRWASPVLDGCLRAVSAGHSLCARPPGFALALGAAGNRNWPDLGGWQHSGRRGAAGDPAAAGPLRDRRALP